MARKLSYPVSNGLARNSRGRTEGTRRKPNEGRGCPGRDTNLTPPKCKSELLQHGPHCSVELVQTGLKHVHLLASPVSYGEMSTTLISHCRQLVVLLGRKFESRRRQRFVCVSLQFYGRVSLSQFHVLKCGRLIVTLCDHFTYLLTRVGALVCLFTLNVPLRSHLSFHSSDRFSHRQMCDFLVLLILKLFGGKIGYK
jgi:hypothetical protein